MADENLIRGAYHAAASDSGIASGVTRSRAISQIGQKLVSDVSGIISDRKAAKQKEKEENEALGAAYDNAAQKILDNSELPAGEWDALYEELQGGRDSYINGDKKQKAQAIRDLNMKSQDYLEYKDLRVSLAELQADKNNGISAGWTGSERDAYMDMLNDTQKLSPKKCPEGEVNCPDEGRMGIYMVDPEKEKAIEKAKIEQDRLDNDTSLSDEEYEEMWMEQQDIISEGAETWTDMTTLKRKIQENSVDTGSRDLLEGFATRYKTMSASVKEGQDMEWENVEQDVYDSILSSVVNKSGNLKSLVHDSMVGDRTFYADLLENLQGQNYEDLGITEDQIADYQLQGVNISDGIDEDEASIIANTMIEDSSYQDQLKTELAQYFTGHVRNNFNKGAGYRTKPKTTHKMDSKGNFVSKDTNNQKYNT